MYGRYAGAEKVAIIIDDRMVGFYYIRPIKNTLFLQSILQEKQHTSQNTNCIGHPFMGRLTFVNCWWNLGSHLQTVLLPVKTKSLSTSILLYAQLGSNVAFLQVEQDTRSIRGLYNPMWISGPTVNTHIGKFGSIKLTWPGKFKKAYTSQRSKWPELIPVSLAWSILRSVDILPLGKMLVHRRVTPQQYVAGTHLYTWVKRDKVEWSSLSKEITRSVRYH